jgi:hypothetical protein
MKSRKVGTALFGASTLIICVTHGCSSSKSDNNGEAPALKPFQANVSAEPIAVAADVDTSLSEEEIPMHKNGDQKGAGKRVQLSGDKKSTKEGDLTLDGADDGPVAPANAKEIKYTVRRGETLMQISFATLGNVYRWREIYRINKDKIPNVSVLTPGTVLTIKVYNAVKVSRNGTPYHIKRGDTLVKISRWIYGTFARWRDLWQNNRQLIHNPNKIYAGFNLYYLGQRIQNAIVGSQTAPTTGTNSPAPQTAASSSNVPEPSAAPVLLPTEAERSPASEKKK